MNIQIQCINFNARQDLKDFLNKNIEKLERYHSNITDVIVYLKAEKDSHKQGKKTEIKLNIKGNSCIAKKEASTFEEGIKDAISVLKRQLKNSDF